MLSLINISPLFTALDITSSITNLESTDRTIKKNALETLYSLTLDEKNLYTIAERKGIPPLVRLLQGPDTEITVYTIQILRNLSTKTNTHSVIRAAGAIPFLIQLLYNLNTEVKRNALKTLKNLADNLQNTEIIRQKNGILPLFKLTQDGDEEIVEVSITTLEILKKNERIKIFTTKIQEIASRITQLRSSEITERANALGGLSLSIDCTTSQKIIQELNGIPPLINLISHCDIKEQKKVLALLSKLIDENEENQRGIEETFPVELLIGLFKNPDEEIKKNCLIILLKLTYHPINKDLIIEKGGIYFFINLLRDSAAPVKKIAAQALRNLALENEVNQEAIQEAGGIQILIELLRNDDKEIKTKAAAVLSNLTSYKPNKRIIRETGGIDPLVELLQDSEIEVKKEALIVLRNLAKTNHANQKAIQETGAIPLLIELLKIEDNEIKAITAETLSHLASQLETRDSIASSGGLVLISLITHQHLEVRRSVIDTILQLIYENETNQKMLQIGNSIILLVDLLKDPDQEIKINVLKILWLLACNKEKESFTLSFQAIQLMVYLLQDSDTEVKINALGALKELALDHEINQKNMLMAGLLSLLIQRIADPDEQIKISAAKLLSILDFDPRITHSMPILLDCIECLINLLLEDESIEIKRSALSALINLTYEDNTSQEYIQKRGAIPKLVELLSYPDENIKIDAAELLFHLAFNRDNRNFIREAGGIHLLVNLLKDPNSELKINILKALTALTFQNTINQKDKQMSGAIPLLIEFLNDKDKTIVIQSLKVLSNLSFSEFNRTSIERNRGLPSLINLLNHPDLEIQRNAGYIVSQFTNPKIQEIVYAGKVAMAGLLSLLLTSDEETKSSISNFLLKPSESTSSGGLYRRGPFVTYKRKPE